MTASPEPQRRRPTRGGVWWGAWALPLLALLAVERWYRAHPRAPTPPVPPDFDLDGLSDEAPLPPPRVEFPSGEATILPASLPELDAFALRMNGSPRWLTVEIQSHTDDGAGADAAMALTRRRADAVRQYLVGQHVDPTRLEVCPYGLRRPRAINTTAGHRAENNRVAFVTRSTAPRPYAPTQIDYVPSDPALPVCPQIALSGAAIVFGVSDPDGDGVTNAEDRCPLDPWSDRRAPRQPRCPGCIRRDADRDGVYDDEDLCRATPRSAHPDPARPGCPDNDLDGDGLYSSEDRCPTLAGPRPDPARPGCPVPDRDDDTVPDDADACPYEPGAPSQDPTRRGCPGLVAIRDHALTTEPVVFAPDGARWEPASEATFEAVADAISASPWVYRVAVIGHTAPGVTEALALRRAEAVADFIASRGVPACALESFGEASADGPPVEFRVLDQRHPPDEEAEVRPGEARRVR